MPDRKELIADRLALTRQALGFDDQVTFAKELGLAKNTYNAFETGKRRISPTAAFKLREKFRIPLDWTYYGDSTGLPDIVRLKIRKSA